MISLDNIPFDPDPRRLCEAAGLSLDAAGELIGSVAPLLKISAVFDEVSPDSIFEPITPDSNKWGNPVIIGLCQLAYSDENGLPGDEIEKSPVGTLKRLVLQDGLDFVEYKIRQYLKAAGLKSGRRLVPGCLELPLEANNIIIDHFGDSISKPVLSPENEIIDGSSIAFVYPTAEQAVSLGGCAGCTRKDCPARISS